MPEPIAATLNDADPRPPLWSDPAYHGMNLTQFLGAFNDNLFKQLVLLLCVDHLKAGGKDYQMYAMAMFALPFVLFSGFGGFLADRISKRRIVITMKLLEIAVMAAGYFAFQATEGRLGWLLVVLFLMGTHSAFFGPPKYGILPELFRDRDLPRVNGMIQMTTFLSIIFGMVLAGFTKEWYGDRLWVASMMCISIAVAGTLTALMVRRTPIAYPGLKFTPSALFVNSEAVRMIRNDRPLWLALIVSSLFWFLGGVVQPSVNAFGKAELNFGDGRTSVMAACIAIGIMVGCLWAGRASAGRIRFEFVTIGSWGIIACLAVVTAVGFAVQRDPSLVGPSLTLENESMAEMLVPRSGVEWIVRGALTGVGLFGGFFVVPLAVFMQLRPPAAFKGRMIGAMNLANWIGILLSAGFYGAAQKLCSVAGLPYSATFAISALVLLPVAIAFRPDATAAVPPTIG